MLLSDMNPNQVCLCLHHIYLFKHVLLGYQPLLALILFLTCIKKYANSDYDLYKKYESKGARINVQETRHKVGEVGVKV